ncbi:phage regulatory protein/antirepressor Ant [Allisonella histaminiformans]|uniref:phage regulatory protein/antirepressor Ant n=1 Tax=Allisonella histaminiformans TaxID=209880 RepID=UPI0022E8E010|nr:phage regulatory protein/antirepressor Ant [Allisonella histaminiformans]
MNNLVEIKNNQVVVDSKSVAENFGKSHRHVNRDIENLIQKDVSKIGHMFYEAETPDSYGRMQKSYYMNRDGFSLLVMGFTGKEAIEWKLKYIEAFNAMEKALKNPLALPNFSNPAEAARAWADEFEKRKQAEALNEANRPKVIFAEAVSTSKDGILVGMLAKLLHQNGVKIGQNRLFQWLRDKGYLMKRGVDKNMPTQRSKELGLFDVKERVVGNPDGSIRLTRTPVVTGKGQVYFVQKFLSEGVN